MLPAVLCAVVALAGKTALRLANRAKRLEDAEVLVEPEVATQTGPIVLFVVCLARTSRSLQGEAAGGASSHEGDSPEHPPKPAEILSPLPLSGQEVDHER